MRTPELAGVTVLCCGKRGLSVGRACWAQADRPLGVPSLRLGAQMWVHAADPEQLEPFYMSIFYTPVTPTGVASPVFSPAALAPTAISPPSRLLSAQAVLCPPS